MSEYVISSLDLHLFFARIMKEHALFLLAGFLEKETGYRKRADHFREEFEKLLEEAVETANEKVSEDILQSGEIVTQFTQTAERQTQRLSGIPINSRITQAVHDKLSAADRTHPAGGKAVQTVFDESGTQRKARGAGYEDGGTILEPDHDGACAVYQRAA